MARRVHNAGPWILYAPSGRPVGRRRSLKAAQNHFDRPYQHGNVAVQHDGTGERWERRGGSWFKAADANKALRRAQDEGRVA